MVHKAGFVNIIGSPNVGKSTLMNVLVGEKVSIITSKAQTTRHRILGIVNGENHQIVFSDTPGVLEPKYKLHESMMGFVNTALGDADIILFITDIFEKEINHLDTLKKIQETETPVLLLLNKIDLGEQDRVDGLLNYWKTKVPKAEVIPISALRKFNTEKIILEILNRLPEHPPYYPKDQLTDKSQKFFASEIIREKIFLFYQKEIPYSCEVVITDFKEEEKIVRMRAEILVARESQKGILIGHRGAAMKKIGIEARRDLQNFVGKQVHLELFVKVSENWKDNAVQLKRLGYME